MLDYCAENGLKNAVGIAEHIAVPETQDQVTHCFQHFGTRYIGLFAIGMLATVDFDDEPCVWAAEINHITIYRHLPFELEAGKPAIAQCKPKHALRFGLLTT